MTFESGIDCATRADTPNPRLQRVADLVARHITEGSVLDIGCWAGGLAIALDHVMQRPYSYIGVDIEPAAPAVEMARKAVPTQQFMVVSSVESLPFEAASFDVVTLTEVIEHVPVGHEVPLLRELARVLKPDGSIILSTPYHNILDPLDPAWFFGHRHYSVERLAALSHQSGLTMHEIEFTGGIWTAIDTNLLYFYKHVLHQPYTGFSWLHRQTRNEYTPSSRGTLATTLWCRLARPS